MRKTQPQLRYELGMVRLGVMGQNLLLNMADHADRSAWLPANLIQAQRDYFGAHTYERMDAKGTFSTQWEQE